MRQYSDSINFWLEAYNDYVILFYMFGDWHYLQTANYCISTLRRLR
jgi:hypothetical protein